MNYKEMRSNAGWDRRIAGHAFGLALNNSIRISMLQKGRSNRRITVAMLLAGSLKDLYVYYPELRARLEDSDTAMGYYNKLVIAKALLVARVDKDKSMEIMDTQLKCCERCLGVLPEHHNNCAVDPIDRQQTGLGWP